MAAISLTPFYCFAADPFNGKHDFSSHDLYLLLTNTQPSSSNTVKSNIVEIAAGGGYPSGGLPLTTVSSSQTSGIWRLIVADRTLNATATIPDWRYIAMYNGDSGTLPLIGYYDVGSVVSMVAGEIYSFDFNTAGVINNEP